MDADAEKSAVPAPVVPAPDGLPRWARPVAAASGAELCTLAGAPSAEQSCAVAPEAESPVSAERQPLELPVPSELALPAKHSPESEFLQARWAEALPGAEAPLELPPILEHSEQPEAVLVSQAESEPPPEAPPADAPPGAPQFAA